MDRTTLIKMQHVREDCAAAGRDALARYSDDEIKAFAVTAIDTSQFCSDPMQLLMICAADYLGNELLRRKEDAAAKAGAA